ncbi:MAG TPA: hypothetical protein VFW38_06090 [Solirubrobacteraceae bacterium]|nr:hypothetical protein [Solirubrobacteraceae bacterium]
MSTNNRANNTVTVSEKTRTSLMLSGLKSYRGLIASTVVAVLALLMFYAVPAFADYEQATEHFGATGEAAQLQEGLAIAVNTTGTGGVEPGSIYVVGYNGRVVRYGPGGEGEEPAFREAWGWGVSDGKEEYERCGPALVTEPTQHTFHTCRAQPNGGVGRNGGEQIGHFNIPSGVAIDQATGDVYVRNTSELGGERAARRRHLVEVFTATGSPIGEGFGEMGRDTPTPAESISEGPEKLHKPNISSEFYEGLAVDESGVVYVTDSDFGNIADPSKQEERVMSFRPEQPNDYEHYVYTGQARDIAVVNGNIFSRVALTDGRLVASTQESIFEFGLAGGNTPVCTYSVPGGQLQSMTANPVTGEVFYYGPGDKKIHRLEACDPNTGKFAVLQAPITQAPASTLVFGLAVNPVLSWGPLRPEGVLYAVDAENGGIGDVFVPAKVFAPSVDAESVAGTTVDSSVLRAEINPNGFTTNYHFQYLPASVYSEQKSRAEGEGKDPKEVETAAFVGALEAPVSSGVLTAGGIGVASAGIGGLVVNTEYRFRVVASSQCEGPSSPACVTSGTSASFSTYPSLTAGLPDGRVYELVSPPEKRGGEVFPADPRVDSCAKKGQCKPPGTSILARFPMQSSANGDQVVYMGYPFTASEGAVFNEYLSRRTASGWQTSDLSPESQATHSVGSVLFDTGLGKDLLDQVSPQLSPAAPTGYQNLYLQEAGAPDAFRPVIAMTPPNRSGASFGLNVAGASLDLSRVFFSANDALTGATLFAPEPADPGTFESDLYEWHEGSLALVNVLPGNTIVAAGARFPSGGSAGYLSPDGHGVSVDGSRVFWTAGGRLYVRVDGEETLEVSGTARFLAASADGGEALLSDGAIARFNTETGVYERAEDLTSGQGGFKGVAGMGEEGERFSRIYYVDSQALFGSGENERGQEPQAGQNNLYVWEGGAPRYIATLGTQDEGSAQSLKDWSVSTVERTAEASPSGQWLAFGSETALTGYDNKTTSGCVERRCSEVFLYDSVSGRLTCVSCNPTGEAPRGPSTLRRIYGEQEWLGQPRYLTDTGRLVFDSSDRLSAADSNGDVEDVYEYEPDGIGTCARQDGCVQLISPGTGTVDSNFLAMDETGRNVFFTSRERLVPQDKDELIDVYDAREDGGFASQTETQRSECQGEACQNTPAPPTFTTPGSTTFSGVGNLLQPLPTPTTSKHKAVSTVKQRRAKALRECRGQRSKRKRTVCEKRARNSTRPTSDRHRHKKVGR